MGTRKKEAPKQVRFKKLSAIEKTLVRAIVDRADEMYRENGPPRDKIQIEMDVHCVHTRVGLRLEELLRADDFNFSHDIGGIERHLNRETGELEDHFLPRFAQHMPKRMTRPRREMLARGMAYAGRRKGK